MHVLISVSAALLMQTPGVHISPIDAAMLVRQAAVAPGHAPHMTIRLATTRNCPCPIRRRPA